MFNYVTVEFPTLKTGLTPDRILSFTLRSENFSHEVGLIRFRDWNTAYDAIKPGTPVSVLLRSPEGSRTFYSYVHYINPVFTPGSRMTEIMLIGASYVFKQASQRIFTNIKAHDIVKQIAKSRGFRADTVPHPRVWDQVAQAGHTDLELMTQLAKRSGYNLRIIGTTVSFKPHDYEFQERRDNAPRFNMNDHYNPNGSTLFFFDMLAGNALDYGSHMKSAISVSGVDAKTGTIITSAMKSRDFTLRETVESEVFDRFATDVAAPAFDAVAYEAMAQEARNKYPYRALIEVSGHPEVYPSEPIYLDGLGKQYSGYWVPLSVDHQVTEESQNRMRYVTIMEVGADSLGNASVWAGSVAKTVLPPKRKTSSGTVLTRGR